MLYDDLVLADLPAGGSYYKMDEASGNVVDSGGGAHAGTKIGTSQIYQQRGPFAVNDPSNFSIGTFVSNDGFDCGDVFEFTGLATFSVECWIMPTVRDATQRYLLSQRQGGAEGWDWLIDGSAAVRFRRFQASALDDCNTTTVPPLGIWSYMVATYDASNIRIYTNTVNLATLPSTKSIQANAATFALCGGNPGNLGGFQTRAAVYPGVVLTQDQINAHMSAALSQVAPGTPFWNFPMPPIGAPA